MSSKIYFNQLNNRFSLRRFITKTLTTTLHYLAPPLAMKFAKKTLLTPVRRKQDWPTDVKIISIETEFERLHAYQMGPETGDVVLCVHGWSGSAWQFYPMMCALAKQGFKVLAYDQPAHGHSDGHFASLPKFIRTFEQVIEHLPYRPVKIIAHSMGAAAVANSQFTPNYKGQMLFVAPLVQPISTLRQSIAQSGFNQALFERFFSSLIAHYQMSEQQVDVLAAMQRFGGQLTIVHDEFDRFSPFAHSKQLVDDLNYCTLIATQNQGHARILSGKESMQAALK